MTKHGFEEDLINNSMTQRSLSLLCTKRQSEQLHLTKTTVNISNLLKETL